LPSVPARDPGDLPASELRDAGRRDPSADRIRAAVERRLGPMGRRLLAAEAPGGQRDPSLRDLADLVGGAGSPGPRPAPPGDGSGEEELGAEPPGDDD